MAHNDTNTMRANAMARYSSANEEKTGHFDFNLGFGKIGFLTSVTASEFGDLRMGSVRPHGYDSLGLVFDFANTSDGTDIQVRNQNPDLQVGTGYSQLDLLQKVRYKASDKLDFLLNLQYSTTTDVPRFDRLNDYDGDALKFAEWYYGPQNRSLASLRTRIISDGKWFNTANIIAAYQRIDEDRINRRFNRLDRFTNEEDVMVFSLNGDFVKQIKKGQNLYYGLEATYNDVQSTGLARTLSLDCALQNKPVIQMVVVRYRVMPLT